MIAGEVRQSQRIQAVSNQWDSQLVYSWQRDNLNRVILSGAKDLLFFYSVGLPDRLLLAMTVSFGGVRKPRLLIFRSWRAPACPSGKTFRVNPLLMGE